jgi:DNA polymerase III sliding clamp (beta) subunit (PCNA family)
MTATIKLPWAALTGALRNVAPFASVNGTDPAIRGVALDYSTAGVAVVATDSRGLCRQDLSADIAEVAADMPGLIVLDISTVRQLWAVKCGRHETSALITVDGQMFTVTCPEGTVITRTSAGDYPAWRSVWDRFTASMDGQDRRDAVAPARLSFTASIFANLAKIKGGDGSMTMTSGNGKTLITCGPLAVCVAQQKGNDR